MTVKTRITLLIVGTGFVSSLLFSVVVFYELIEQPFDLLDTVLREEAYRTVRKVAEGPAVTDTRAFNALSRESDQYWIEIYEQGTNKVLFRSRLASQAKLSPVAPGFNAIATSVVSKGKQGKDQKVTFRVRTFQFTLNNGTFIVQIARPMEKLEEEIQDLGFGLLAGLIFSTLVLIAISIFVAGKILQPIGRIKDLAQKISEKNLEQRIPAAEGQDEFSQLARTVNRMLDRLQNSFVRQKEFLFDTSHELKTPLTTMRLAVDDICAADHQEALPSWLSDRLFRLNNQVLRMERLVKDLLSLSSLEVLSGLDLKPLEITALLASLADEYRFLADVHNITMDVRLPKQIVIQGDVEKLRRAFSNILDNAVKYNVDGGRIELTAEQSAAELTVVISNTGAGVAATDIPKVFDQFYRAEKSRSIEHGGSGLGLAIVKKIIVLHGGGVDFESRQEGWIRVIVHLPWYREQIQG